jgi:hypothetical protein
MIANLFTKFGWSRDDAKWSVAIIIATIVALATLSEDMVKTLGLPLAVLRWLPWCRLIAFVVGVVSGTMKTSNLFARGQVPSDAGSIDVNKRAGVGAVLLASALCAGVLVSACAGQGRIHPNLSPVGQVVANVNTLDDATAKVQANVAAFVTSACGANQTASCPAAKVGAPVMRTAKLIGDGSVAVGEAFKAYLAAKDVASQAAAKQTLLETITALETDGTALAAQAFSAISADVTAVTKDIQTLKASTTKGL